MRRVNGFERDFQDLHGRPARRFRVEIVQEQPSPKLGRGVDNVGLRLVVGFLGLYWALIIGIALAGFIFVSAIFTYAFFTT